MADGVIRNVSKMLTAHEKQRGMEWSFLRGCFDYGIMPTDVDGIVERNGRYLVFEEKSPGVELTTGQRRMLEDLNRKHSMTIFIVWGDTAVPFVQSMSIWRIEEHDQDKSVRTVFPASVEILKGKCRNWFLWADDRPAIVTNISDWLDDYDGEKQL